MRRRRMSHLSTCYYMGILAIADTSVLLLGLSVMWLYLVNRQWSLLLQSTYGCKFLSLLFYTVADVSVWLVCMMSADRCIAVTRPLHANSICTVRRARISVLILVICIILINIQFLFTHHLSIEKECTYHERYEFFSRQIWPWIDAAVYSALPFILLLTMNLIIVHSLFQARRSTSLLQIYQSQITRHKNKLLTSMSKKLTTMLLAVTFFFLLSSFPMVCLQIYTNIHKNNQYQHFAQFYLKPLCETLQYSNHCINFFLYAITGKAFRHELKRLFRSIAVKMHLAKKTIENPPIDRRTTAINLNYLPGDTDFEQRLKEIRTSPMALQLLHCQQSMNSTVTNGTIFSRHFQQKQQQNVRKTMPDVDLYADATFLGWLVASFSLGQLIASPIIGYIANRTNNNKLPLVISTALIVVANLLYAYIQSINNFVFSNKWWIMLARFIMGIGAANSTIMRSYASSATTVSERTNVMANLSAYQGVGFILGPLIQALFAFLSYPGPVHKPWLYLNIYTAPAFFSVLTGGINLVLFLITFKDVRIVSSTGRSVSGDNSNQKLSSTERHDQLMAIICCLYMFFVAYLTFTNYETIASPLSIDMYAWSKEQSTRNNGYILGALGCMSVVVLLVTKFLAKRFQDRALALLGLIISFLGYFIFLPWGTDYPSVQIASFTPTTVTATPSSTTLSSSLLTTTADSDEKGCPLDYQWCYTVPRVQLWQYITASVVITIGFSISNVICYSIFSKKLGDRPQGTMMGIFTSAGSLARAFGPITVGFLYKHWGPRILMIFMLTFVLSSILSSILNYKRLYIENEDEHDDSNEQFNTNSSGRDRSNSNNNIA
ncbi:unnamed protein product [Rotaria sp. Silwood1]|nr:unnamed protein product [Rotaria sp. Silwood1]CAF3349566.1 unnamed protein product [Rotaria sp. Silwood1]CAF3354550.1 unnamed protein product [Rotaria sp. Silwood1]